VVADGAAMASSAGGDKKGGQLRSVSVFVTHKHHHRTPRALCGSDEKNTDSLVKGMILFDQRGGGRGGGERSWSKVLPPVSPWSAFFRLFLLLFARSIFSDIFAGSKILAGNSPAGPPTIGFTKVSIALENALLAIANLSSTRHHLRAFRSTIRTQEKGMISQSDVVKLQQDALDTQPTIVGQPNDDNLLALKVKLLDVLQTITYDREDGIHHVVGVIQSGTAYRLVVAHQK